MKPVTITSLATLPKTGKSGYWLTPLTFLKIYSEDENFDYLPIWSNKELASAYAKDSTEPLKPKEISLPEFLKKWIAGLEKDDLMVGVFPTLSDKTVWIMEPGELKDDINDELAQF